MDTRNLTGRTALVTGAASGIGRATALAFGRRGADLVLCDLDEAGLAGTEKALQELGRRVLARRVDVTDRDEMHEFAAAVHAERECVDILMNNAGVGLGGGFLDTTLDDWDWIVGINLMGVVHGCHLFVPPMVKRGRGGHVINVASAAGYLATEALSAYSTTKFGVVGLSEALHDELGRHGIGVTVICPGIIDTHITRTSRLRGPGASEENRQRMIDVYRRRNYTPQRVAQNILKAVQRGRLLAPITPEAWSMYALKRLSPRLMRWVNGRIAERVRRETGIGPE